MEETIDPVLRCDSCQELLQLETLHKVGGCSKCGNRRVRNVLVLSVDEEAKVREWGFSEFLERFEATADA